MTRLFLVLTTLLGAWPALAARVALLIANADYGGPADLRSPPHDLALMQALVEELAFDEVITRRDATRREMIDALKEARVAARGGEVLFYYSGHGVEVDGQSYLLPAKMQPRALEEMPLEALGVQQILGLLREARLRVLVLDACRNNPFSLGARSGASTGLARDKIAGFEGTLISYSAAPGTIAYDGPPDAPSVYTAALARSLRDPSIDLPNVFLAVRGELLQQTRHLPRGPQRSEEVSSLTRTDIPTWRQAPDLVRIGVARPSRGLSSQLPPTPPDEHALNHSQSHPLRGMRVAVAFSELTASGPIAGTPTRACVEGALVDEGVRVLSAEDPAVDVVLKGRVRYVPLDAGRFAHSVSSVHADVSLRAVKADTQEVLFARRFEVRANGISDDTARHNAAKKVCEAVSRANWPNSRSK